MGVRSAGRGDLRRKLLWVDGSAGAVVGTAMLSLRGWLSELYDLPLDLLLLMGAVNLAYATFSLSLAMRSRRPMQLLWLLIVANLTWAILCLRWAVVFGDSASVFGLAQLVAEALFVGVLACLEWRWRDLLRTA